ncbi:hypothetical protein [Labilibacter marinus]|uniref:hypothetical protein n=1 Tax=Labilibacter marinus TaxID=1477105 RepID=UPI0009502E46|nr:hypothetical protein [Labilibacter marinus]
MKRVFITILFLGMFFSTWAVRPYFRIGQSHESVHDLTAEVTKLLLGHDFEVLGMYHPNDDKDLCVIVFTCDQMTSMATSVADKGAFGAALKVGLVGHDNGMTDITLLNPHYIKQAYFSTNTNRYEAVKMTAVTDSLIKEALSPLVSDSTYYGKDIPKEELWEYHFMPTMAKYEDTVELNEFSEYLEAIATIKTNLLKGVECCELVYELTFDDKEIAIFGVSFNGEEDIEKELIELLGIDCITSMPLEILVQGNKAFILNGRYRIPVFKTDLSRSKVLKIFDIASDVKSCLKTVVEWED